MKTLVAKAWKRVTWGNAKWFAKVNVMSWVLQGALFGLLTLVGVGTVGAVVSAKIAAWVVFIYQVLTAAKS